MQKPASDLEPVILEATNLGRGLGTPNVEVNGEVKEGDLVTTLGIKVWLVTQNRHFVLPKANEGHFHSGWLHLYIILKALLYSACFLLSSHAIGFGMK